MRRLFPQHRPAATAAVLILPLLAACAQSARADSPFPDKNLEAAIRDVLKHEPKVDSDRRKTAGHLFPRSARQRDQRPHRPGKMQKPGADQAHQEQDQRLEGAQGPDQSSVARPGRKRDQGHQPPGRTQGAPVHRAFRQQDRERRRPEEPDQYERTLSRKQRDQGHRPPGRLEQVVDAFRAQESDQGHLRSGQDHQAGDHQPCRTTRSKTSLRWPSRPSCRC